ncbi:hypothetical protein ACA910_015139 [Epithemia clementina (nom. ined.)]
MSGKPCIFCACCCCYDACDFQDIALLCHGSGDFLCLRSAHCMAAGVEPRGVGCVGEKDKGECCKIGCYCCDYGLVTPRVLCASYSKCLCFTTAASCPTSPAYMDKSVCAVYFLSCAPCGCCVPAPECPAVEVIKRGETVDPATVELMENRE